MSKGLKKIVGYVSLCLMAVFILPNYVKATQNINYTAYKVGDKITVDLDGKGGVTGEFIVIENSNAGVEKNVEKMEKNASADYQWVTAIYVGTVGDSIYTDKSEATTYENSVARSNLSINTTNLNWKSPASIRLLKYSDITSMISTLSESAQKEIYGEECTETNNNGVITMECQIALSGTKTIDATALKKYFPFLLNTNSYWLGDTSVYQNLICEAGASCATVMVNYAKAVTSDGIKSTEASQSLALRPVIKIHKGFVEGGTVCNCLDCEEPKVCPNDSSISIQACIDGGTSEADCIKKLCTKESKTCPNDSSISIQACIDGGTSEADCVKKLCTKESKTCPNDSSVNIQACIDGGKSEEYCIKKLCPGTKTPENPKTGTYISLGIIFGVASAGIIYFITNKKKYFSKI